MTVEIVEKALAEHGEAVQKTREEIEAIKASVAEVNAALIDMAQSSTAHRMQPGFAAPAGVQGSVTKAMKSDAFKAFAAKQSQSTGSIELDIDMRKALTSLQGAATPSDGGVDVTRLDIGARSQVLRPLRVFETLPVRALGSGNTFGFNKLSLPGGSSTADYQEHEGDEKAAQALESEWIDAPIVTIAAHTTVSTQVLEDEIGLSNLVDGLLRYAVADKIDRELLNGSGVGLTINGLVTQASPYIVSDLSTAPADRIGSARAFLQSVGYNPTLVYLHPNDWFAIASERASDGQYVVAGWNTPASPSIYNMQAIPTPSIAQGTALVLDPNIAVQGIRMNPTVEMSRHHNGNFTKNMVTVLAEQRLGLLVMDQAGMVTIDLAETST